MASKLTVTVSIHPLSYWAARLALDLFRPFFLMGLVSVEQVESLVTFILKRGVRLKGGRV